MSTLTHREQSLVALGAAIASNCVPCIEYHVPVAKKIGLSEIDDSTLTAPTSRQKELCHGRHNFEI